MGGTTLFVIAATVVLWLGRLVGSVNWRVPHTGQTSRVSARKARRARASCGAVGVRVGVGSALYHIRTYSYVVLCVSCLNSCGWGFYLGM